MAQMERMHYSGPYRRWELLLDDVRRMNLFREVELHCVAIGEVRMGFVEELAWIGMGKAVRVGDQGGAGSGSGSVWVLGSASVWFWVLDLVKGSGSGSGSGWLPLALAASKERGTHPAIVRRRQSRRAEKGPGGQV